jgi:hypothetical protein
MFGLLTANRRHLHVVQPIHKEAPYMPFVPLIPFANEHGTRRILDFINHHGGTTGVELDDIAATKRHGPDHWMTDL